MKELYIAYYRVSTDGQGSEGLGLQSQKPHVTRYIAENGVLLGEFQDIESGGNNSRTEFAKAIEACKASGATLVVYDISRLSRGGFEMMYEIQKSGVKYLESSAPNADQFSKNIKFLVAAQDLEKISENTKKSLNHIKEKLANGQTHISKAGNVVTSLGNPENLTQEARDKSIAVRAQKAKSNPNNVKATAFMKALRKADSKISFKDMANQLNEAGFRTSRNSNWSIMQTSRIYNKYC